MTNPWQSKATLDVAIVMAALLEDDEYVRSLDKHQLPLVEIV